MAERGIPSYFAVPGSCAIVTPPAALISRMPNVPSEAVPERMMPIARAPADPASEAKKVSTGVYCERSSGRALKWSVRPMMIICAFGGIT
jgi:hypothetical protein